MKNLYFFRKSKKPILEIFMFYDVKEKILLLLVKKSKSSRFKIFSFDYLTCKVHVNNSSF